MGKTRTSKTVHSIQCKIFGFTGPLLTFYLLFIFKWCCGAKTGPIVVVFTTVIPKNLLHYCSNRKKSSGLKWFPPKRRCTDDVLYGTSLIKWKILLKLFYLFYSFYFCMKWYSQTNWIKKYLDSIQNSFRSQYRWNKEMFLSSFFNHASETTIVKLFSPFWNPLTSDPLDCVPSCMCMGEKKILLFFSRLA